MGRRWPWARSAGRSAGSGSGGGGQGVEQAKAAHDKAVEAVNAATQGQTEKRNALAELTRPGATATPEQKAKAEQELGQATANLVDAKRNEQAALAAYLFADLGAATGTTGVFPVVAGGINKGPPSQDIAKVLLEMQNSYMNIGGSSALLTSCVTALDQKTNRLSAKASAASMKQTILQREKQNIELRLQNREAEKGAIATMSATPSEKGALASKVDGEILKLRTEETGNQAAIDAARKDLEDALKEAAPNLTPFQLSCLIHVMPGLSTLVANDAARGGPDFIKAKLTLEKQIAETNVRAEEQKSRGKQSDADKAASLAKVAEAQRQEAEAKKREVQEHIRADQILLCKALLERGSTTAELVKVCLDTIRVPPSQQSSARQPEVDIGALAMVTSPAAPDARHAGKAREGTALASAWAPEDADIRVQILPALPKSRP